MKEKTKQWMLVALAVMMVLGGAYASYYKTEKSAVAVQARTGQGTTTLGTATVDTDPDAALVTFKIENSATTAEDAQIKNSKDAIEIEDILVENWVPPARINTVKYALKPENNEDGEVTGFTAMRILKVEVHMVENAGRVVDSLVNANAENVSVSFHLKEETRKALEKEVLRKATYDAEAKATEMARGLKVRKGSVIKSSQETSWEETGEGFEVTGEVSVTYEM